MDNLWTVAVTPTGVSHRGIRSNALWKEHIMAVIANIQHGTVVRHRDGHIYRVGVVEQDENGVRVSINREGFGGAFIGTPEQAREQGFAFGDEPFYSNGRPISHYDIPAAIDMAERFAVGCLHDELGQRNTVLFAISAGTEVLRLQRSLVAEQGRSRAAQHDLDEFRTEVREAIVQAQKDHDLCIEGTNAVLENLGLEKIKPKFTVIVTRDSDGETLLTVTGVEADDAEAAKSEVRDNFTVKARVQRVQYDYEYEGEGDANWDEEDWEDDDVDEEEDSFADSHRDGLTFSVEEE